jgi:ubiquinone/menaquinone biosynthesis C-methylase UbiE
VRISERVVDVVFRVWSGFYDAPFLQQTFYRRVHAQVMRELEGLAPRTVVDLGCGTGLLTADLRKRFPQAKVVVGADLSHEMMREGRSRHDAFVQANVYALPLAGGSADLLTSTISYHFYVQPERALREIRRVVGKGGTFILATMVTRFIKGSTGILRLTTIAETRKHLEQAGFSVVRIDRVRPGVAVFVAR